MNTDPLCPQQHTHPKHSPNRCIFCEYGAAVRADALNAAREAVWACRILREDEPAEAAMIPVAVALVAIRALKENHD